MHEENKRYFPTRYALLITVIIICAVCYATVITVMERQFPFIRYALYVIKVLFALSVISSCLSSEAKCSWIFLILALPIVAIPAYCIFCRTKITKKEKALLNCISEKKPKTECFNSKMTLKCNHSFTFLEEIAGFKSATVYNNTAAKYIADASEMIRLLSVDILRAKKFVFIEFYTISSGKVFGTLCDLLAKRAAEGVEVRIIYDELGSLFRLPEEFVSNMKRLKIKAVSHASLIGTFPSALNNRNHRKIAIIDGEVAYTGGINLADEYINPKARLGKWKDAAVRIEGEGVCALTYTFLSDFSFISGTCEDFSKYYKYRKRICEGQALIFDDGPAPIYTEKSAKTIIISMLRTSQKYFTVTTPYLVCGTEILSAIDSAVKRGVCVKIVIPSKPDKFFPGILTRHYAGIISKIGARVYVYSPGFLHSKTYSADGKYFMCGTVNLDYRSLSHNFENGVLFASHPIIQEASEDFEKILRDCVPYEKKKEFLPLRLIGAIMQIFAPLF